MRFFNSLLLALILVFPSPAFSREALPYDELVQTLREHHKPAAELTKQELIAQAWTIGKILEEDTAAHRLWSDYSGYIHPKLSEDLGMEQDEFRDMESFSKAYPDGPPQSALSWEHYKKLLEVKDPALRKNLEERAQKENWSIFRLREEVKARRAEVSEDSGAAPEHLSVYPVVRKENGLTLDLGFGIYFQAPGIEKFKEGDCVQVSGSTLSAVLCTPNENTYLASVTQVVDGDTLEALVDLGFGLTVRQKFRLRGINTPEMNTAEGVAAKQFVYDEITKRGPQIMLRVFGLDKYNRYVAEVWINGVRLSEELLKTQHAVSFEN